MRDKMSDSSSMNKKGAERPLEASIFIFCILCPMSTQTLGWRSSACVGMQHEREVGDFRSIYLAHKDGVRGVIIHSGGTSPSQAAAKGFACFSGWLLRNGTASGSCGKASNIDAPCWWVGG